MLQEVAHIYDLLTKLEERFPDKKDMLCRRSGKEWIRFSVKDYVRYSHLIAYALSSMGYGKGDKAEADLPNFSMISPGAVPLSLSSTLAPAGT